MRTIQLPLLIFMLGFFIPVCLQAQSIVDLSSILDLKQINRSSAVSISEASLDLKNDLEILIDSTSLKTLHEVCHSKEIFISNQGLFNYDTQHPHWLKVELQGDQSVDQDYLFLVAGDEHGHTSWNYIDAFMIRQNGDIDTIKTGNAIPNKDKPIPSELNLAPFRIGKNERTTLFIQLEGFISQQELIPKNINLYLVRKELIPGAFEGYPFEGYFIKHDKKNSFNCIWNHKLYIDSTQQASIDFIDANWNNLDTHDPLDLVQEAGQVYWLKTRIVSNPYLSGEQLLQVSSRSLHHYSFAHIDAFVSNNGKEFQHIQTGERVPKFKRDYPFWASLIPLHIYPGDSLDIYIRLEGTLEQSKMGRILLKHIDHRRLFPAQIEDSILSGIFFGIFGIQSLFFFLLFLIERDRANLYLLLMVLGCILALTIGDPDRHFSLFPRTRNWAIAAWCYGGVLIMTGFIKFTEAYFSYHKDRKLSRIWIPAFLILSWIAASVDAFRMIDYSTFSYRLSIYSHLMQALGVILTVVLAVKAPKIRGNSKTFYSLAFLPVAACVSFTLIFLILGRVPFFQAFDLINNIYLFVVQNGANIVRICLIISFTLFALSIGYRTNILRADQQLLHQLAEKNAQNELLLKEIHHRVKNNLEVVSSLLELQSVQVDDKTAQNAIQASQSRVQSMGIIHQKLYQRENLASIEMKDYFSNLVDSIIDSYQISNDVDIEFDMEEIELDVDTAVPIGLIVNEVLTNSFKYAFPSDKKGLIRIHLKKLENQKLHLVLSDNGVGKSSIRKADGTGFGTQLIALLTRQLNGTVQENTINGTSYEFEFNPSLVA